MLAGLTGCMCDIHHVSYNSRLSWKWARAQPNHAHLWLGGLHDRASFASSGAFPVSAAKHKQAEHLPASLLSRWAHCTL
jgi:hypothetical protein